MSAEPAKLAGLSDRKGKIAVGYDADLVVWDPAEEFSVNPQLLHHRHKLTPYSGRRLRGVVKQTYVRGLPVLDTSIPCGDILRRECTTSLHESCLDLYGRTQSTSAIDRGGAG